MKKEKIIGIVNMLLIAVMFLGGAYAFFDYYFVGEETVEIIAGDVYMNFTDGKDTITMTKMFPMSATDARNREDNYITFTITGRNGDKEKDIYYEIKLLYGSEVDGRERFNDEDLRFDLEEKVGEETKRVLSNVSYDEINNTRIWVNTIPSETTSNIERTYTLRMWLKDDVLISDTNPNATYTTGEYAKKYASVKVEVVGDFKEKEAEIPLPKLYDTAEVSLANYLLEDDEDARILSGGGGYNDGNPIPDPDFKNYVWYSGKLWRIVALNNDGSIKLVTQDNITTIQWGANTTFYSKSGTTETKSWMYEWLNEDFLDTLYNAENIIDMDTEWNSNASTCGQDENYNFFCDKPSDTATGIIEAPVGLLTAYEYSQSYSKTGSDYTGYLHNGYYWWLLTPYSSSNVMYVLNDGHLNFGSLESNSYGVRPSINLSSNIKTSGGDGSLENPYMIEGDISAPTNNVTKLNERVSGEYVDFNGETYRIVSIENNITKITKLDYLKSGTTPITKKFSSSDSLIKYGSGTSSDYWDYYLNNDWYNSISESPINYKGMIVKGDWYLGMYPDNVSYKATICTDETINQPIKNCTKLTGTDSYGALVYNGYVGLGRAGEMFASMMGKGYKDTTTLLWTITPYSSPYSSDVRFVSIAGTLGVSPPGSYSGGARPSINLSSNIVITSGLGTVDSPFEITLAS